MTAEAIELFYVYSRKDDALRQRLDTHLSILKREDLLSTWHDQEIIPGSLWEREISKHLNNADIILLLVSSDFIASDYCYGIQMQRALERHVAGEATVIPIIMRPTDWTRAPFAKLEALPSNGKPITTWSNRDAALAHVAQGIRKTIYHITGRSPEADSYTGSRRDKYTRKGVTMEEDIMISTPAGLTPAVLNRAIARYHKELKSYEGYASHELALRSAFQNLLADTARAVNLKLVPEETIKGGIRPDGVLRDTFLRRGIWEAKGPNINLEQEIQKKITAGYPLENALFENTRIAILYQNKKRNPVVFDLSKASDVRDLLRYFLTYTEPEIESFESAVQEFKNRIPELAGELLKTIDQEYKQNKNFIDALETFAELCRTSLNPQISQAEIKEMLVQHLLTERLFRTIFQNSDFVNRNAIAAEIEKVIQALTSRAFNRQEFLRSLDRFYVAIEAAAKGIEDWSERQHFLNTVYERFFQGFSVRKADTHGIVYTPQEIVNFMVSSVDEVLEREFGKSLAMPGVKILDPATGTGNFLVNIMRRIPRGALEEKYKNDLFCNEIMLLPYYIASLNIEHEYYDRMGQYIAFEGICFADTLELAETQQLSFLVEKNTERVEREKAAEIMVVIGNPPYNVGQKNENDNNKNRKYKIIDGRISETYVKYSNASLKTQLYDAYVRFFRWATDRLGDKDGIICFVSNNSFINGITFDGFRKQLAEEFTGIYHLDLGGNLRKLGGGNVFGIKVGVGITILVRKRVGVKIPKKEAAIFYYKVADAQRGREKLTFLQIRGSAAEIEWQSLQPDKKDFWITEGMNSEFASFVPVGMKNAKSSRAERLPVLFKTYSGGVKTNRDLWVYDFSHDSLEVKIKRLIESYNTEVDKWKRRSSNTVTVDDFVNYDNMSIKWSEHLKHLLVSGKYATYAQQCIRRSLYRPFTRSYLYFDSILNDRQLLQYLFFPTCSSEQENIVIVISDHGHRSPFSTIAANVIVDFHLLATTDAFQCFPYYAYAEDGSNRRENITDWALEQFRVQYGQAATEYGRSITKWDIFHYIYAMLHHPQYRERYAENLKRDLPHIPLLLRLEAFEAAVSIGQQLMNLHVNYEQAEEYTLKEIEDETVPYLESRRVEKMKLAPDRSELVLNKGLTLAGIPEVCFRYRLGNRSALEWIIDQYQVTTDKNSRITSDPNRLDDPEYIVKLVKKVVTVSVKTVELVEELAQAVTQEDWLGSVSNEVGEE